MQKAQACKNCPQADPQDFWGRGKGSAVPNNCKRVSEREGASHSSLLYHLLPSLSSPHPFSLGSQPASQPAPANRAPTARAPPNRGPRKKKKEKRTITRRKVKCSWPPVLSAMSVGNPSSSSSGRLKAVFLPAAALCFSVPFHFVAVSLPSFPC